MKYLAIVSVYFALVNCAFAADDPPKLTVEQVMNVAQGLASLDCAKDTIKDGASEKEVCRPYKFGGGLVLLIARDLSKARGVIQAYQTAHNQLIKEMSDPATGKIADARVVEFSQEDRKITSAQADADLDHIRWVELKVGSGSGENPVPPSVVSLLQPILDQ